MSTPATPPPNPAGDRPDEPVLPARSRLGARVRPEADFELMLALRGAAHARDLRNRVVRPRTAETRPAVVPAAPDSTPDGRDLAHSN